MQASSAAKGGQAAAVQKLSTLVTRLVNAVAASLSSFRHDPVGSPVAMCPLRSSPGLATPAADLSLGSNAIYRDYLLEASTRTGMDPAALAAIVDAEAAKKKGVWDPASENATTGAKGLTQFVARTWRDMAMKKGSLLNEEAKARGLVDKNNKIADDEALLELRADPRLSVVTAAEYAKANVAHLGSLVPAGATDDQKAWYAYVAHHEGPTGAAAFLTDTKTEASSKKSLEANRPNDAEDLAEEYGSYKDAYHAWFTEYSTTKIQPGKFRSPPPSAAATSTPQSANWRAPR